MLTRTLRRCHLYVGLFLSPWVLMYTFSTFVMNHRTWFRGANTPPPVWSEERQLRYEGTLPAQAAPRQVGAQLLASLGLDGAFVANRRAADGAIVIQRLYVARPVRVTFQPLTQMLIIERQAIDGKAILERMHRRRGYQQAYLADGLWAMSVDVVAAAVMFWAMSGVWLWWEMKATRRNGLIFGGIGLALFFFFMGIL